MYAELVQKCLVCKEPGKDFYNYAHEKTCTDCMKVIRREKYKANREKIIARVAKYRKSNPDKIKHTKLSQTYGLSFDEYQSMLKAQRGVCAVCLRPERAIWRGMKTRLAVDHNHTTGDIRGLLCQKCNRALGLLEESESAIKNLLKYIGKHKK